MARFQTPADFQGTYAGRIDGRKAKLEITVVASTSSHTMRISLVDEERSQRFSGTHLHTTTPAHMLQDVVLKDAQGGEKVWSKVHLHTWDTRHLSGVSVWDSKNYGFSFTRI